MFLLLHLYSNTEEMAINSNTDKKLKNDLMNFVVKTEIKNKSSLPLYSGLSLHFQSLLTRERTITKIEIKVGRLDY